MASPLSIQAVAVAGTAELGANVGVQQSGVDG